MDLTRDKFRLLVLVRPLLVAHFLYLILSQRIFHTFFRLGSFQLPFFSAIQGTTLSSKPSKTFPTLPFPVSRPLHRCCHRHPPLSPFPSLFPSRRNQQRVLRMSPCSVPRARRCPTGIRAFRTRLSVRRAADGCLPRKLRRNRAMERWRARPSA